MTSMLKTYKFTDDRSFAERSILSKGFHYVNHDEPIKADLMGCCMFLLLNGI